MRTTIRLENGLLEQAKREAQRRGKTLTALIEESLRQELARSQRDRAPQRVELPVSNCAGGLMPGVDLNNSAALLEIMEAGLPLDKLR